MRRPNPAGPEPAGTRRRAGGSAVLLFALVGIVASLVVAPAPASAQDEEGEQTGSRDDAASQLADQYAPVVFVIPQDAPCDSGGEPFEPAPVEIVLDNPEVFLRQVGNDDPVAMRGPGAADVFDLREGWYLDFPGDALEPGCIFEQDFGRFHDGRSVVYAHVATQADRPGLIALQYWFFWYHNLAKNDHEGDWEFVQLVFEADSAEEALTVEPVAVGYAQHEGGERSDWGASKLDTDGVRPVVYPARGSHAAYYGQAWYLGRSGGEGFGCDTTDGATRRIDPSVVMLPDSVDSAADPFAWLAFLGRWGQRETGFFNGPTGPYAKGRWDRPIDWQDGLRDSSVVIPQGDGTGDSVITAFCRVVEVGSTVLVIALRSPVVALVTLLVVVVISAFLASRTRWSPVLTAPIREDRAIGQIIRAALRVWRDHPGTMTWVGLVYIPLAFVTALFQAGVQELPFVDALLALVDDHSALAFLFAVFVGSLGNLLAYVYVSAVVALTIERGRWRNEPVFARKLDNATLGRLLLAVLKAGLIVAALMISVVGIPWAIRQLIRYQLVPQAVALEGAGSGEALRRSSQLVTGRWWWTAAVIAVVQVVFAVAGLGAALLVLVLATSIPLWLFSVLSSAIYVVLVPVGAAAMAYVYGTLCARATAGPSAAPEPAPIAVG